MNKLHKIIVIACLVLFPTSHIFTRAQEPIGANPYTYSPQLFNAENGITGRYWAGNKTHPGKAFIEETEYTHIIAIEKAQLQKKTNKKLKKDKEYLGSYIDTTTNVEFCLYGNKKNPEPIDDAPDADVLTQKAIKVDYGIGE